jgi:hypothetical protein
MESYNGHHFFDTLDHHRHCECHFMEAKCTRWELYASDWSHMALYGSHMLHGSHIAPHGCQVAPHGRCMRWLAPEPARHGYIGFNSSAQRGTFGSVVAKTCLLGALLAKSLGMAQVACIMCSLVPLSRFSPIPSSPSHAFSLTVTPTQAIVNPFPSMEFFPISLCITKEPPLML